MSQKKDNLTSKELLERIGLGETNHLNLLDDEPLNDLHDDLGDILQQRYRLYVEQHHFTPGDLVTWKSGMRDRRCPLYGQPAVVVEVLSAPIQDSEQETGSCYFRQQLDLVLGVIQDIGTNRGEMLTFHFDSHRFRPWK